MGYKRVQFTPYAARSVQEGVLCPPGPVRSLSQAAKLQTGEIGRFDPESLVPLSPQKDPKGTEQPPIPRFKRKSFIRSHPAMCFWAPAPLPPSLPAQVDASSTSMFSRIIPEAENCPLLSPEN